MSGIEIVIPIFNEAGNIERLVDRLKKALDTYDWHVLFVDDGSLDNSLEVLKKTSKNQANIRYIHLPKNTGFGNALKTGLKKSNSEIIITMDGDNTHDPEEIPNLLRYLNGADLVIGSRYIDGGAMLGVPVYRKLISKIANGLFKILTRTNIKDITSGFRCIKREVLNNILLESSGFEIQLEMSIKAARKNFRIIEVPIRLSNRTEGTSKFSLWREFRNYIKILIKMG